MSTLIL